MMAFCPKCKGPVNEPDVIVCPNCGYDLPLPGGLLMKIASKSPADLVLAFAAFFSVLGCFAIGIFFVVYWINQNWLAAFVYCPFAMLMSIANVIVFMRVGKLR